MEQRTAVVGLIRRARRRLYIHLSVRVLGDACTVLFAGLILAFLTGTGLLGWPFAVVLSAAALGFALWRSRRGIGTPYQTAQQLDRRLGLPDSLSTALFFFDREPPAGHRDAVNHQRSEAERLARAADARRAFPFVAPRGLYVTAALLLAAGGTFFLRYGITHTLDLSSPLVHLPFGYDSAAGPAAQTSRKLVAERKTPNPSGQLPAIPWASTSLDNRDAANNLLDAAGTHDGEGQGEAKPSARNSTASSVKSEASGKERGDGSLPNESPQDSAAAPPSDKADAAPSTPLKPGASQSDQNQRGLMDRMKDAMSDLLSTLKPNSSKQGSSPSKTGEAGQSGAQRQASSNTAQTANNAEHSAQEANAQGESGAQSGQKSEALSKGRSGDNTAARNDSPDAKSGIGTQDGNKEAKYAEQLAAMGKISELIGKRSANVTGEVTVEVPSGNQQLKTQYSGRSAAHSDTGGEIDRDEVPLAYQSYIRQYFEEIRKQPAPRASHEGASGARQ